MNEKEIIARKLAAITGKPISEFFNGTIQEKEHKISSEIKIESSPVLYAQKAESDSGESVSSITQQQVTKKIEKSNEVSEELLELQKLFKGSKISGGGKLTGGRQMTKKEYNKYTKNMTIDEYYAHPLMFKIFRAEGQLDPSFMTFPNKFPKEDK